ncbi:hypothetical protein FQZ97_716370 [compost metagenome]
MLDDRLAELHPLARITQGRLEGRTGDAEGLGGDADAPAFEVRQGDGQALATLAQQVLFGDAAVGEGHRAGVRSLDAHLVLAAVHHEAGGVGGHQEGGEALLAQFRVGHREDDGELGALAVADELLGAVEHPLAVHQLGAGAQVVRFRAGLGFGEAEAADGGAAGQLRQPEVLLRFAAEVEDGPAAHRVVDAHQRAEGAVAGGDFLHRQGIGHVVDVAAAPLLGHHHAEQAQLAHLLHQPVVDPAGLFPGLGPGRDLGAGEVPRHVADHALLFGEFQVLHCVAPERRLSCPAGRV